MRTKLMLETVFTLGIIALSFLLLAGCAGADPSNPRIPVYFPEELRNITEIPAKYRGEINDEELNIVLEAASQGIRTFDNDKYEKIQATLSEIGFDVRNNVWVDRFSFEFEGSRDGKTESWQMEIEHPRNEKNASVTRVLGGGTLVPDKYANFARSIALKNLDEEILNKTPEIVETSWIIEKPGFVVLKFKALESPPHTIVTVDLNKNSIDSVEKISWYLNFPIYFTMTSNPSGADVYISKGESDMCGPQPYKKRGVLIGKTPITYEYEYTGDFLPASGLFTLFSFNLTGYEDAFYCEQILNGASGIQNISVDLKPFDKNKKTRDFEEVSGYVSSIDYLFDWDEIPGNDEWRLRGFLKTMYIADWTKRARIEKTDNGRTVDVFIENKSLSLRLKDEKTRVYLKTDDNRTYILNARTENTKLKIYGIDGIPIPDPIVYLERYDENGFNISIDDSEVSFDREGNGYMNVSSHTETSHWFILHETQVKNGFYLFDGLNLSLEDTYRISVKYLGNSSHSASFNFTGEEKKNFINVSFEGTEIPEKNTSLISALDYKKILASGVISLTGILSLIFLRKRSKAK